MRIVVVVVFAFLLIGLTNRAEAYLDPGSGSMVFQLIVGGIAGLILAIKIFWRRILSLFGIKANEEAQNHES